MHHSCRLSLLALSFLLGLDSWSDGNMLAKETVGVSDGELAPVGVIEADAGQAALVLLQGLYLSFAILGLG